MPYHLSRYPKVLTDTFSAWEEASILAYDTKRSSRIFRTVLAWEGPNVVSVDKLMWAKPPNYN